MKEEEWKEANMNENPENKTTFNHKNLSTQNDKVEEDIEGSDNSDEKPLQKANQTNKNHAFRSPPYRYPRPHQDLPPRRRRFRRFEEYGRFRRFHEEQGAFSF